jgi:hypothetical protein
MYRIALLFALLTACATPPGVPRSPLASDNFVQVAFTPPAPGSLILLLPVIRPSPELTQGELHTRNQLTIQLRAAGYRVALLDEASFERIWNEEVASHGGLFDPKTGERNGKAYLSALTSLTTRVCEEARCDLVLQHRLVSRRAQLKGTSAEWDGQRRTPTFTKTAGFQQQLLGSTAAVSVELTGISPRSGLAFVVFAGASLPYTFDAYDVKADVRTDLFKSDGEISEAVALAVMQGFSKPR